MSSDAYDLGYAPSKGVPTRQIWSQLGSMASGNQQVKQIIHTTERSQFPRRITMRLVQHAAKSVRILLYSRVSGTLAQAQLRQTTLPMGIIWSSGHSRQLSYLRQREARSMRTALKATISCKQRTGVVYTGSVRKAISALSLIRVPRSGSG